MLFLDEGGSSVHSVIPGHALRVDPESETRLRGSGFRVRAEEARPGMTEIW